jgi:hypothetical protein
MPELIATLEAKQKSDYDDKKFLAAMQGVDLDKNSTSSQNKGSTWEEIKARAFSKGRTSNPNDILSLSGAAAEKAGFGIGHGLDYEVVS